MLGNGKQSGGFMQGRNEGCADIKFRHGWPRASSWHFGLHLWPLLPQQIMTENEPKSDPVWAKGKITRMEINSYSGWFRNQLAEMLAKL